MTTIKLTEADVANCTWQFECRDGDYNIYIGHGTHPVSGVEITVEKKEPVFEDALIALNSEERASRDGKRWSTGHGSDKGGNMPMVRVARVPLNKLMADATDKMREGDKEFLPWLLNSPGYEPFRTKTGKL